MYCPKARLGNLGGELREGDKPSAIPSHSLPCRCPLAALFIPGIQPRAARHFALSNLSRSISPNFTAHEAHGREQEQKQEQGTSEKSCDAYKSEFAS
jgi:hypothetical protein